MQNAIGGIIYKGTAYDNGQLLLERERERANHEHLV